MLLFYFLKTCTIIFNFETVKHFNMKRCLRQLIFILFLFSVHYSHSQSSQILTDSCVYVTDMVDTSINCTYSVTTDSGYYLLYTNYTSWSQNTTISFVHDTLYNFYNVYDSSNQVTDRYLLSNTAGQWQFYRHTIFSYDSLGMNDSLSQYYNGSVWVDSLDWSWQKDTAGNFIYSELKNYTGTQWNNVSREEWYYDILGRDTLHITYQGNINLWDKTYEIHRVYNSNGLTNYFELSFSSGVQTNVTKYQIFYQAVAKDTLRLDFNGNANQWDSLLMTRKVFDGFGNPILVATYNYNGLVWVNNHRILYTYDGSNRVETKIDQQGDSTGNWNNLTKDSISYGVFASNFHTYSSWNGTNWVCNEFDYYDYYGQFSYLHQNGYLDPVDCLNGGYYIDEDITLDSAGHQIARSYDGHTGSSEGSSVHYYDAEGFLYYFQSSSTSMGGFTHDNVCYYFKPFLFNFEISFFTACPGDSIIVIGHPIQSTTIFHYEWRFNNILLNDSTPVINIIASHNSGWYTLKMIDNYGNFYLDSAFVSIHPSPELGNDTMICLNNNLLLDAGNYTSYAWQDGSSQQALTVTSVIQDTVLYWVMVGDSTGCFNTDSITVYFSSCLGQIQADQFDNKIFPNPTRDVLVIQNTGHVPVQTISILDVFGNPVLFIPCNENSGDQKINISSLIPGVYFLQINYEKQRSVRKFIKYSD
jgi:hypothetical protein